MNYISCIVRILEIPKIELASNNIEMVRFRVQLPSVRNKVQSPIIIYSTIWGNLAYDIISYYRINDYALVEGYISTSSSSKKKDSSINLNITKLYPFLFKVESDKRK
jgi:hypothetical protein|uniref:hypothetical protein n=1 Tax=Ulnaria ulna TaxID=426669 RepID=UPI0027A69B23|nr:hypothetical protein RN354_pgp006 [Ulnaria ulna]WGN98711.1 hypothetical protein [Ulnaria ulna]